MAETDPCKCATPSTGLSVVTASTFSFQMCEAGQLVTVPAATVAEYLVNTIYGDVIGDPPAEGCYNVCYDAGGNRTISTNESTPLTHYELQEAVTIFPDAPVDPDDRLTWGRATTRILGLIQPPVGYIPTHVKLRIWGFIGGGDNTNILRDTNSNRIFIMQGFGGDDDHSSVTDVMVPVQQNINDDYEVYITGDFANGVVNIKQIGYSQMCSFDGDGNVTPPTGGETPEVEIPPTIPVPLEITYLNHTYSVSGVDQTIVEWYIDDTLVGTDEYNIHIDMGEVIHTETVTHVVGLTSDKQRLTIDWTVLNNLKVDVSVQEATYGSVQTSNFGTSDVSIPPSYETAVVV